MVRCGRCEKAFADLRPRAPNVVYLWERWAEEFNVLLGGYVADRLAA